MGTRMSPLAHASVAYLQSLGIQVASHNPVTEDSDLIGFELTADQAAHARQALMSLPSEALPVRTIGRDQYLDTWYRSKPNRAIILRHVKGRERFFIFLSQLRLTC